MFSDKIKSLLDEKFSSEILVDQFASEETLVIQKRSELKALIEDFFKLLNLFILSGEYVDNKETKKIIKIIDTKISQLISNFDSNAESQNLILSSFFYPIKASITFLKEIDFLITNKISRGHKQIILQSHKSFNITRKNDVYGISEQLQFLEINYKITKIDHELAVNEKQLEELLICIIKLSENYDSNLLTHILIDKCKLLCSKISQRFKDDEKNYLYAFEFQDKEIRSLEEEIEIFSEFRQLYQSHYFELNERRRKKQVHEVYTSIEEEGYDLLKFHSLIKNYKDDNKSLLQLENLIAHFSETHTSEKENFLCEYDRRSWNICKNYIFNNRFSLFLRLNPEDIKKHYDYLCEIEKIQDETNVKNYFPYLHFLKNIKKLLEKELSLDKPNFKQVDELMKFYEETVKKLYLSFEWCKDNNFQAYVLDKKKCQLSYDLTEKGKIKLFVASSFILPLNYKEVKIDIDNINNSFEEFKTHIPLFKRLLKESVKIENTEKEIERRDRNQIEILGIFAAIVLFAAGGINIFKNSPSIQESAKYSLIFSYSLGLFVVLIWLVTRDKVQFKPSLAHIFIAIFFLVCTYLIFSLSFYFWPFH